MLISYIHIIHSPLDIMLFLYLFVLITNIFIFIGWFSSNDFFFIFFLFYRDAWRYQGVFSKSQKFRGLFPGLFWGIGAFAIVSVYEDYIAPKPVAHGHAVEH